MAESKDEIADLQQRYNVLQKSIDSLKATGVDESLLAPLRDQAAQLELKIKTLGGAVVKGDVSTGGGAFIGRDQNVIVTNSATEFLRLLRPQFRGQLSPESLQAATEAYLNYLLDRHRYLSLKGMGVADRVPLRLELLDLYVPLQARQELPEGETWRRDIRLAGRSLTDEEQQALRLSEPQPVLDILQGHDGLIVLGDPGSGKTTFLKYISLMSAMDQTQELGMGKRLPILVPLSAYANVLQKDNVRLDNFISDYFHEIGADLPIGNMLEEALSSGAALILLDGLDEVKDFSLRHTVVERVVDFYTFHRRSGNKFVLTSRVVGYRDVRPTAEDLAECTLVDFEDEEIEAFVNRWTAALEKQAQGETALAQLDAERERQELMDSIQHNPGVHQLAANPLLLTILALMKRQGVTLPERRVELYDRYIETMLSTWNRARSLSGRAPGRDPDVLQTTRILAPLALWMHEVNPGVGLVKSEELRRRLEEIFRESGEKEPESAAHRFMDDVREYAGLLLERGPEEYGFIHLTFEEYLAAVALALRGQGDSGPIVDYLSQHVGEQTWREISRLTVSYLGIRQQLPKVAGEVLEALVAKQAGSPGQAVILAGEAALDAWPGGIPEKSKERVIEALLPTMQSPKVEASLRRRAGLLLGRFGWLPDDLDEHVKVPSGKFLYGENKESIEIPCHYWIAKYPVTNAQYARFISDKGYEQQNLWSDEGWAWRTGRYDSKAKGDWEKDWLSTRPPDARNKPYWWGNSEFNNPIFPVVGICWFEAEAYCNWLNTQSLTIKSPDNYTVRLPTEEEWERAARGTDGPEYPWGDEFELENANIAEGGGTGATAICTYPQGASPTGVWDMSGNVWEWTRSWFDEEERYRVLRGGSWDFDRRDARCACRYRLIPGDFYDDVGFRVVVSLADTGF
jgi:formylglycine-generating enzyme required for sulfatase activity